MVCPACGVENRVGRRFCSACGSRLVVICPSCGTHNEPGEAFCGECGSSLAVTAATASASAPSTGASTDPRARAGEAAGASTSGPPSPSAPQGAATRERKVATILFADLVGFTSLNEANDPELVQTLVGRAFDRLTQEVERYEGLIEKFAGDAMLVLFGVPQSHEDDAERAVRAALEMHSAMAELAAELQREDRPDLALRIGIETGEVLVDQTRAAGERDRMVTGDPVNTASRLQAEAQPGQVLVAAGTYAATRELVDYEELAPATLKGKSQPVAMWRAVSVKARRGGLRSPLGIEAPLVGRDTELALLKQAVRHAVSERRPHLVTVVGAAGVGKSRLTWELEKYLDGLPESYVWRKGRCVAYAQASFGALADLIRADAGILEDDASAAAIQKLDDRLDVVGSGFDDRERAVLRGILGLGPIPEVGREELFDTFRRYLEGLAAIAPAVLVFEDIHWADDGLLDLIENLARWGEGPIVLLGLARHELLERRPAWGGGVPNATSIVLEPLPPDENARLVEGLVPGGIPVELQARIVELAGGNPLFTEELLRMFIDRGVVRPTEGGWRLARAVDELEIPGSVQAVLAARLDALPAREKQLAQDAAVVGRIFWDAVLGYLGGERPARVDDLLRRLRVKELVVPREPSSLSGAAEFGFRHVLIRDVAYESLPKRERAAKHLFVAEWAERELADRGDDAAELLASHYLSALRYEEEFSTGGDAIAALRASAFRYARLACERAGRLHDRATATRWARVALELAPKLGLPAREQAQAAHAFLEHGFGYWPIDEGERVATTALAALATIDPQGFEDLELEALIRSTHAFILLNQDRGGEAQASLRVHLERLEAGPPTPGRAVLLTRLGWTLWRWSSAEAAIPVLERALVEARSTGEQATEAWALHDLGVAHSQAGRGAIGAGLLRQSMDLAKGLGNTTLLMRGYTNLASVLLDLGAPFDEVERLTGEGLELARRTSGPGFEGWMRYQLSDQALRRGRMDEAAAQMRRALQLAEESSDVVQRIARRQALAWIVAQMGDWAEAEQLQAMEQAGLGDSQGRVHVATWSAVRRWRTDPGAAVEGLARELPNLDVYRFVGTLWLARMAFRTGDQAAMQLALDLEPPLVEEEGPFLARNRAWVTALGGSPDGSAAALVDVARTMEAAGTLVYAEMAWADAALAMLRAGDDPSMALARVAAMDAETGVRHILGPLPETRWVTTHQPAVAEA